MGTREGDEMGKTSTLADVGRHDQAGRDNCTDTEAIRLVGHIDTCRQTGWQTSKKVSYIA